MVKFNEVISGEYTPFLEKGCNIISMLYKQIYNSFFVNLNNIDRNGPK